MKYLIFFILVFLFFRLVSYYLTRYASVKGSQPRQPSQKGSNSFKQAEDADFEIIEDDEKDASKR